MKAKIVKSIKRKGFPTSSKYYKEAHAEADMAEKRKYPKQYKDMKKIDNKVSKNKLVGKNTKSGKILISKVVPKKDRKTVKLHEMTEHKAILRLRKKNGK